MRVCRSGTALQIMDFVTHTREPVLAGAGDMQLVVIRLITESRAAPQTATHSVCTPIGRTLALLPLCTGLSLYTPLRYRFDSVRDKKKRADALSTSSAVACSGLNAEQRVISSSLRCPLPPSSSTDGAMIHWRWFYQRVAFTSARNAVSRPTIRVRVHAKRPHATLSVGAFYFRRRTLRAGFHDWQV